MAMHEPAPTCPRTRRARPRGRNGSCDTAASRDAGDKRRTARRAIRRASTPRGRDPSTRVCRTFRRRKADLLFPETECRMSAEAKGGGQGLAALASLRRFVRPRAAVQERCELCDAALAAEHAHLVELASRRLVCACDACAILFDRQDAAKYRRVPRRIHFCRTFACRTRPGRGCICRSTWPSFCTARRRGASSPCIPVRPGRRNRW